MDASAVKGDRFLDDFDEFSSCLDRPGLALPINRPGDPVGPSFFPILSEDITHLPDRKFLQEILRSNIRLPTHAHIQGSIPAKAEPLLPILKLFRRNPQV